MQSIHSKPTKRRKKSASPVIRFDWSRLSAARRLDLLADIELSNGHIRAAEKLAHAAAQMREVMA